MDKRTDADLLKLTIESVAYGGMGIARHNDLVHFVPATLSGETVLAAVTERKKTYVIAEARQILNPSPARIAPPCPYFQQCGGCSYLHMNYEEQLRIKHDQVHNTLTRLGKIEDPPITVVVPSPQCFNYRNRITLHKRAAFGNTFGFFANDNKTVVPIERCLIAHNALNAEFLRIRKDISQNKISIAPFDELILTTDGHEREACFTTQRSSKQTPVFYKEGALAKKTDSPFRFAYKTLRIEYGSQAFFQTNTGILEILCCELMNSVDENAVTLIDAFCGVGIFSLLLRERFKKVLGIEENQHATAWAQHNAEINDAHNVSFLNGRVEQRLSHVMRSIVPDTCTLLLDPPRSGVLPRIISEIVKALPRTIIYISCEPTTLARDLAALSSHYVLERVIPFDMFPQTKHIETLSVLTRKQDTKA
jgi:tRNA/tmRNA/rRNA uracil-C5-methylase (TrmA/RlmC/RlmD family)